MSDASTTLNQLADRALDAIMTASPITATTYGIPGYDHLLPEVTEEATARIAVNTRAIAAEVEALDVSQLDAVEATTRLVLIHEMRTAADIADQRTVEFDTAPLFVAPHAMILQALPKNVITGQNRAEDYLERLHKVAGYLDSCGDQLRLGTSKGRTPAARSLKGSIPAVEAYLASDLETDLLHEPKTDDFPGRAEWEAKRTTMIRDEVRPAMQRLLDTYNELLSSARGDDQIGLRWLPDGERVYEVSARAMTTTNLKPQELHELGLSVLEGLEREYAEIGQRALGTSDPKEVRDRMRNDPTLRLDSVAQLREVSQAALDRCKAALPQWFGLLPDTDCVMEEIPAAEARTSAPAYYRPPNKAVGAPGTYWINGNEIQNRALFDVETIAFHEAIPGHHMQIAIGQELPLPFFRRIPMSAAFAEGWGLYTERLADEMGLYSSDLQRLGMLSCDSWRACRLVLDTGLHALGWSYQKAVDFMAEHTPIALSVVQPETERYVGMPGQALAYMVGRLEIQRMRREAEQSMGERFDIKGFHDTVLGGGTLPLAVLDQQVRAWAS
jgi:uncharacterized protein (DUF885 family)